MTCLTDVPQMPFIISLGAKPDQCFDAITPNDMHTNLACAWTGACLIAGGFCTIMWGASKLSPPESIRTDV